MKSTQNFLADWEKACLFRNFIDKDLNRKKNTSKAPKLSRIGISMSTYESNEILTTTLIMLWIILT